MISENILLVARGGVYWLSFVCFVKTIHQHATTTFESNQLDYKKVGLPHSQHASNLP